MILSVKSVYAYGIIFKLNNSVLENVTLRRQNTFIKHDKGMQTVSTIIENLFKENETYLWFIPLNTNCNDSIKYNFHDFSNEIVMLNNQTIKNSDINIKVFEKISYIFAATRLSHLYTMFVDCFILNSEQFRLSIGTFEFQNSTLNQIASTDAILIRSGTKLKEYFVNNKIECNNEALNLINRFENETFSVILFKFNTDKKFEVGTSEKRIGVSFEFPTKTLFYPKPLNKYDDLICINGYYKPAVSLAIKINYCIINRLFFPKNNMFLNTNESYIKYTAFHTDNNSFKKDLYLEKIDDNKLDVLEKFSGELEHYSMHLIIVLIFVLSCFSAGVAGILTYGECYKYALKGIFVIFSLIGVIISLTNSNKHQQIGLFAVYIIFIYLTVIICFTTCMQGNTWTSFIVLLMYVLYLGLTNPSERKFILIYSVIFLFSNILLYFSALKYFS